MRNVFPLHLKDFYKCVHIFFYEKGTEMVYSNFTPRSTKYLPKVDGTDDKIVLYGLQYFIKYFLIDCWNTEFFNKPKNEVLQRYKRRLDTSLGKDAVSIDHIAELYDLGYLPIIIKALPEGVAVNAKIPFFTIKNTHPKFFWLTNFLEDAISCLIWRASYAATVTRKYRIIANKYARQTGVNLDLVDWILHDFSLRGCAGVQDALMIGSAFLLFQKGTDNIIALDFLEDYYNANADKEMIGGSIPANEHSCVCVGGEENEFANYKRWITETYPHGMVSLVSDSWNLWRVITDYLPKLKTEILNRNGKTIIRPDSSPKTPLEIICGDPEASIGSPEHKGVIQLLWDIFGGTVNGKGFKELDSHIGCIYGEGLSPALVQKVYQRLMEMGFAMSNIALGVGSMSFVLSTRDSVGYAAKATAAIVNSELREIYKDPVTDDGMKKSAKGLLRVDLMNGEYVLKDQCTPEEEAGGELKEVFRDGRLLIDHSLKDIRARVSAQL